MTKQTIKPIIYYRRQYGKDAVVISREIPIERLVETLPDAIAYLREKGIRCILCGEPIWGTLEEAAREKGMTDEEITIVVEDLNRLARAGS